MVRKDTDLPFGDAFSPNQIEVGEDEEELSVILDLVKEFQGRPEEFDREIKERFFSSPDRAKNVRLGLSPAGYKITDEDFEFTDLGEELYELRTQPEEMYNRFAEHILRNLHGLKGIEIIEDLEAQGKKTTNKHLKEEFIEQYDFHIDEASNHWSQMRGWLSKAGIVNTRTANYDINRSKIESLIGVSSEDILELDKLSDNQQAFLRALALIDPDEPIKNSVVKSIAEEAYGVDISQSNISRRTLDPLQDAGYIEWEHTSGKPNLVKPTDKFESEILVPVLEDLAERVGISRSVLRQSFEEIQAQMDSDSTFEKGVALETLTVKIGRILGLDFAGWRVRGRETGGTEVDIVMDEIGKTFNRFQIQCKNTESQLETKHIAREVGITRTLQTNTLVMVARNGVSQDGRIFAKQVMRHENIAILFLTGDDLDEFDGNEDRLLTTLRGQARMIHRLKRLGRGESVEQDEETKMAEKEQQALEKYADELEDATDDDQGSLEDFFQDN